MQKVFSKILVVVILIILVGGGIFAWQYFEASKERISTGVEVSKENAVKTPRFEDFPILEQFQGVPAPVDFSSDSSTSTSRFATEIIDGVKKGPNFAGHFTIIWLEGEECGTGCQLRWGVVFNAKTGAFYELPSSFFGFEFRINSNLLIVNPPDNIPDNIKEGHFQFDNFDGYSSAYYKWEDNRFKLIYEKKYILVQTQDEITDWPIYRNEEYGFEVKYPSIYNRKQYCRPVMLDKNKVEVLADGEDPTVFIGPIDIRREKSALSLPQYMEQTIESPTSLSVSKIVSKENITLGGREAIKIVLEIFEASWYTPTLIFTKQGEWILIVEYNDGIINQCPFGPFELPSEVADQILSTFRFLE